MQLIHAAAAAVLLFSALFSSAAIADSNAQCRTMFQTEMPREALKATVPTATSAEAQALLARKWEGISDRGFVSGFPEATGPLSEAVSKGYMLWWYIRIFVMPTVEAAKAHSALEKDPLMQGVYLINTGRSVEETAQLVNLPGGTVFRGLLTMNPNMYFFKVKENGATEIVPPEYIAKNLKPENMKWDLDDPEHGPYIRENGWALPRYRGVIEHAKTVGSSTYANVRQLARKLHDQGFKVTFSRDFKRALNMVRDQKRFIEGQWVANSLYAGENNANYKSTLERYEAGTAYSVEVWNEKGEMVGGIIGFKDGSLYSPESTFYDNVQYPKISIGFAKVASLALTERLKAAGIDFIDVGMVSPFSASMKGELIDAAKFETMAAGLPKNVTVDMTSDWTPPPSSPRN